MIAKIAFSGGMESTYLAQMFLEKEHTDVELYFGAITCMTPDPIEASLVYRNYDKLKELYPTKKITLHYVNKNYFETADIKGQRINYVNQAFRVTCLCTDLMSHIGDYIVACGWTGGSAMEESLTCGCYTKDDYLEMLKFPRTINHLTRASAFPHTIQAPLWGMTKREIFNKLNPELLDYVVVNNQNGKVVDGKLDEYDAEQISYPNYIENKYINLFVINDFGRYFYTPDAWASYFNNDLNTKIPYDVFTFTSPTYTRLNGSIGSDLILSRVDDFKASIFKLSPSIK